MSSPLDLKFIKALAVRRQGSPDDARSILEEILDEDPEHEDSLEVLGMLLAENDQIDQAIELTKKLAELQPDSIMAHANLSRFYMLKGDKETAESWQSQARVLGWKEEIKRKGNAPTDGKPSEGIDPETLSTHEQAVEDRPDDPLPRLVLATSYLGLGMVAKAVSHLKMAQQLDGTNATVYLHLGKALHQIGASEEAQKFLEEGIQVAESHGAYMPRNQMQTLLAELRKEPQADLPSSKEQHED
ncbi:MAG: tetratricopeptide repeat protein [Planctomycetota bacterium]|nr:tetratricopeptide repeat protein [Planctomycetota bacterium]